MSKKSLSDHIMTDEDAKQWGNNIKNASFIGRLFNYTILYIIMWLILMFILSSLSQNSFFRQDILINKVLGIIVFFGSPAIVLFFIEMSNREWRKENGFNIYKKITKEQLQQKAVDERVAMEKEAYEKAGVNQGVDKNDIGYWFGLKESGAITEDEFNEKKAELLGK